MNKTLVLSLAALVCGVAEARAQARDAEAPAAGWVEITHGARTVHAWLARPEGEGPFPAIIVIHQNRGSSEWSRSVADRIAGLGYLALAPDLLSGMAPGGGNTADFADPDAARDAIGRLPGEQVMADLNAVADYLKSHPDGDGRVSVSGFCWGGSRTFALAAARPDLEAAYVFYGTGPQEAAAYANVGARVYGFYGGADNRVNATIDASQAAMVAAGKTYQPVIYDGAGHGFMQSGESAGEGDANHTAMEAAWRRWRALLAEAGRG